MSRILLLVSGVSLAALAVVGFVDALRDDNGSLATLFAVIGAGIVGFVVAAARRDGIVLRRDLATWVERTSAVTGETPQDLTNRAVSRLRAGFTAPQDSDAR
jgi:hypothetical protein